MSNVSSLTDLPRVPFLVRNGYGITALCALLTFPLYYPVSLMYEWSFAFCARIMSLSRVPEPPIFLVFLTALLLAISPPMIVGFSLASRYLVKAVKYYLDQNDQARAEEALLSWIKNLWYRDYQRNQWLQNFIRDRKIHEKSPKLARFAERAAKSRAKQVI